MYGRLMALAGKSAFELHVRLLYRRARRHRAKLDDVTFVGITGSCGKTTTKELVAAVLERRGPVVRTPGTHNAAQWVPLTLLEARPHHAFCVQELGASGPGSLDAPLALVRPRIAVVTNIGDDHRSAFRTMDATMVEKRKLVEAVPADGVAVLNADDPRVLAMAPACRGRVVTYGLGAAADVRAERVASAWPGHLAFVVDHRGESLPVHTRLNGVHWVHAILAAIATGLALGLPLAEAVEAVGTVQPWEARLSELEVDGVTFLRDDGKAPLWTVEAAVEVLRRARAPRRVAVFGTISDYHGRASSVYAGVARRALDAADEVIFVGPQARRAEGARSHPRGAALRCFESIAAAAEHLGRTLRPGDVVLLKGSNRADHLLRLALARGGQIGCWRGECRRLKFCDACLLRRVPVLPHLRLPGRAVRSAPLDA
jgi:UDP-N-acetylmuramyl pentapeptide synthase